MARFRVGPVRFGGGRGPSVRFGAGPVGVTVGGRRRRRGGSSGPNYDSYDDDGPGLTPAQSALYYYDETSWKMWSGTLFVLLMVLLVTSFFATPVTPLLYAVLASLSIVLSLKLVRSWSKSKKAVQNENPTDKELRAWALVQDGFPLENLPLFGRFMKSRDREAARVRSLQEFEGVPEERRLGERRIRRVSFWGLQTINFVFCYVLMFPFQLVLKIVTEAIAECADSTGGTQSHVSGVSCTGLSTYQNVLYVPWVLIFVALGLSFITGFRTGAFLRVLKWLGQKFQKVAGSQISTVKQQYRPKIEAALPPRFTPGEAGKAARAQQIDQEIARLTAIRERLNQERNQS